MKLKKEHVDFLVEMLNNPSLVVPVKVAKLAGETLEGLIDLQGTLTNDPKCFVWVSNLEK